MTGLTGTLLPAVTGTLTGLTGSLLPTVTGTLTGLTGTLLPAVTGTVTGLTGTLLPAVTGTLTGLTGTLLPAVTGTVSPLVSTVGGQPLVLPPAPAGGSGTLIPLTTGPRGPSSPGGGGLIPSRHAASLTGAALPGLGAGLRSLAAQAAGAASHGSPAPSAPVSSRWPAGPGGPGSGARQWSRAGRERRGEQRPGVVRRRRGADHGTDADAAAAGAPRGGETGVAVVSAGGPAGLSPFPSRLVHPCSASRACSVRR